MKGVKINRESRFRFNLEGWMLCFQELFTEWKKLFSWWFCDVAKLVWFQKSYETVHQKIVKNHQKNDFKMIELNETCFNFLKTANETSNSNINRFHLLNHKHFESFQSFYPISESILGRFWAGFGPKIGKCLAGLKLNLVSSNFLITSVIIYF